MKKINWIVRRKLKKHNQWFILLIMEENVELGLDFYEKKMDKYSNFLPKEIRIVYYYYKWLVTGQEKYFESIDNLRIGLSNNNNLLQINSILEYYYAKKLALTIIDKDFNNPNYLNSHKVNQTRNPILLFSMILIQTINWIGKKDLKRKSISELESFLKYLPKEKEIHDNILHCYHKLLINILVYSGQYESIIKLFDLPILSKSIEDDFILIKKASLYRYFKINLYEKSFKIAFETLKKLASLIEEREYNNITANLIEDLINKNQCRLVKYC